MRKMEAASLAALVMMATRLCIEAGRARAGARSISEHNPIDGSVNG